MFINPQLTLLGAIKRLGNLINQLSYRLSQLDRKISSLKKSNHYIMIYLGKVDDQINSLKSNWEETRDTTEWF